ncbi:MAG: Mbeg1-like protein [Chordicoccus sp.]
MDTLENYVNWRGDIPFSVAGFTDADAVACSVLAYLKLDMVWDDVRGKTLREAYQLLHREHQERGGVPDEKSVLHDLTNEDPDGAIRHMMDRAADETAHEKTENEESASPSEEPAISDESSEKPSSGLEIHVTDMSTLGDVDHPVYDSVADAEKEDDAQTVSMSERISSWRRKHEEKKKERMKARDVISQSMAACIRALALSGRFGNAVIEDYRSEYDPGDHFQFAVTMLRLDSGIHIVTFRGSDDSTAGWKEDFLISFTKTMAQRRALAYLMDVIPDRGAAGAADPSKPKIYFGPGAEPKPKADSFIICGHSKGGNLALYACPQLTDNQLSHVRHIYLCDAPGLSPDEFPDIHPERIDAITTNILPEYSIFGRLFEPALNNTEIVKSTADGVLQHAPESWIVTPGGGLSIAGKFDVSSGWINDTMEQWLESVSSEDRLAFVNQLFGTIEADGCSKMTDFIGESPLALENLVSAVLESDDRSRRFALKRPFTKLKSGIQGSAKKAEKRTADDAMYEPDFRTGLLLAVIGAVLLLIPSAYADALVVVLFAVLVAAEYVTLILRLRSRKWNLAGERMRVIICTVLTVFFLFTVVKSGSLYLPGDILFCSWFLISAYVSAAELHTHKKSMHPARKLLRAAEAVVFAVFGVAVLVLPAGTVGRYSFWAGVLLAGDGLLRMVESLLVQRALERMLR